MSISHNDVKLRYDNRTSKEDFPPCCPAYGIKCDRQAERGKEKGEGEDRVLTTVNNAMDIVEVCQAFQDGQRNLPNNINIDWAYFLVDSIQRALVRALHADADIGIREKGAVERYDVWRMTFVHDLQFT